MVRIRHFTTEDAETIKKRQYPDMTVDEIERMIADWNSGVFEGRRFEMPERLFAACERLGVESRVERGGVRFGGT